jgi:hypothetical protein
MDKTIKLFKALEVSNKKTKQPTKEFLELTLKYGVIFTPNVIANYSNNSLVDIAREIGLTSKEMNTSFHKSWEKIKNSSMEKLFIEQVLHYFTTYGLEEIGSYNKDTIYIPAEKLDVVKNETGFIIIKGYTKEELKEKLLELLESGIALKQETVDDCVELATYLKIDSLERINNKEVRVALGLSLGLVPSDPTEFLRLLIYHSTKKTLLIKDKATITAIKEAKNEDSIKLIKLYQKKYGLEHLAWVFHRFKPLFLAYKYTKESKTIVNQIRRLADLHHKPMKEDYLNSVTANISAISVKKLKDELEKANIFRKIRLAYALKFRMKEDNPSIMYRVRNGKAYSKEFSFKQQSFAKAVFNIVIENIINDVKVNVKDKKIYIPDYITYALPSSEKMFTGEIPSGTCIQFDKDMLVGVHWNDVDHNRIDLDLSMTSVDGKIGWDARYRTDSGNVLFSGDMTAAPKPDGATELLYVKRQGKVDYIVCLNYFNYNKDIEVPMQIVVGREFVKDFHSNYTINPNNVLCLANTKINQKQKILGLLIATTDECKFYFCETYLGNSITTGTNDYIMHSKNYLYNYYQNTINLNDILVKAGAKLVTNKDKCDIDLSPQSLQKDTIINLIKKTK